MRSAHPWMLPTQPVTRALLLASGISRAMIATQVRSGRLVMIRHGVYLSADAWPQAGAARHLVMGHAEQVANPGAVLSHQSLRWCGAWPVRRSRTGTICPSP